jgi:hypothetical protein
MTEKNGSPCTTITIVLFPEPQLFDPINKKNKNEMGCGGINYAPHRLIRNYILRWALPELTLKIAVNSAVASCQFHSMHNFLHNAWPGLVRFAWHGTQLFLLLCLRARGLACMVWDRQTSASLKIRLNSNCTIEKTTKRAIWHTCSYCY